MSYPFAAEESRIRAVYAQRHGDRWHDWANPGYVFILQDLERRVLRAIARRGMWPLRGKRILEIGCGTGHWLRKFLEWGAGPDDVVGVDLLPGRVARAKSLSASGVRLMCASAGELPLGDECFDLVAQFMCFTCILDPALKRQVAREMVRVLKPSGLILWYDFFVNNPRNHDHRAVGSRELHSLFPACTIQHRRVTLAPPVALRLVNRSSTLCSLLNMVPLLRTHYLALIRTPTHG
jgi:SAM-dependent methyltransferase